MPYVEAQSIYNLFPKSTPKEAIDLLVNLFDYDPGQRYTAA